MSTAVSIAPSGDFDGNDGLWSTFPFRIGNPPQAVKLLIATSGQETWAITPDACAVTDSTCRNGRGYLFNISASTTWEKKGAYQLSDESNLGYVGNGSYGFDTILTGWEGQHGLTVNHSIVAGTKSQDFYLGQFGLSPRPTNFTDFEDSYPSFLTLLKKSSQISTLSYGYTAGAHYRNGGTHASLTVGGYDVARFNSSNVSFAFTPVTYRDIVVGISSISITGPKSGSHNVLSPPVFAYVDAATPHIWLPESACKYFESDLGLLYDDSSGLYLVSPTLHDTLLANNYSVTFELFQKDTKSVEISLPYTAFDLQVSDTYPGVKNKSYYFPIRRAKNETQYTLGRTFLQEAYMVVDYEQQNFSISPCTWDGGDKRIVAIVAPGSNNTNTTITHNTDAKASMHLPTPAIIGITIGALVAVVLAFGMFFVVGKWRRKRSKKDVNQSGSQPPELNGEVAAEVETGPDRVELYAGQKHELEGDKIPAELNGAIVGELDSGAIHELDTTK
ncbi:aspartic peptidase domain-containing protein [Clohesyomyces aquaticus]|uniref:Aspartic peptidase domain-containing protein n=1 Tax=Clohesyomyces aquaticus TaxID=1231657 RepID=A0A1Y1YAE8_9PLEO|nr:aspartic peptidase domain-containing protein [Clohesyomyces aquaticus]